MANDGEQKQYEIPKECKAGVVVNEGPNFHVEVQMVPVPEPGALLSDIFMSTKLPCPQSRSPLRLLGSDGHESIFELTT